MTVAIVVTYLAGVVAMAAIVLATEVLDEPVYADMSETRKLYALTCMALGWPLVIMAALALMLLYWLKR
ncbi:hypothetical protein BI081_gp012 [Mycobacterium phage Tonenili]|uniref:Uncharacterized protein n=1 Tax=Mycobacterium phage Tonenili TaxID=1891703 RepID=A0A1C9EGZ6_9CAUD|nr:hypothetical protein BI081_gp012 [Mycobacterium phage Tonenili]AON96763.1 hypothetical protein SEA_TONENILI_12 [Mycobacterium phage Tonenili]